MAKKKAETNGAIETAAEETPGKSLSNAELKTLFRSYDKAQADVERVKKELEAAMNVRSTIVEQIHAGAGKGPFGYKGQVLTIVARKNKSTGEQTFFFKGPSKSDLTEVG